MDSKEEAALTRKRETTTVTLPGPEDHSKDVWEKLRQTAQLIKENLSSLPPVYQFALCVSTFLKWAEVAESRTSQMPRVSSQFREEVVESIAHAVVNDRILIANAPGKEEMSIVLRPRLGSGQEGIVEPQLDFKLRSINWLETGFPNADDPLRTSLFWVLIASVGVDPGPLERIEGSIGTLDQFAGKIMKGQFARENPPKPFKRSLLTAVELIVPTAIEGVTVAIDQNSLVSLCFSPKAIGYLVEACNEDLNQANFGNLTGSSLDIAKAKKIATLLTTDPTSSPTPKGSK